MEDQVPGKVKTERGQIIRELSLENRLDYFNRMMGEQQTVLLERPRHSYSTGYGEHYIPIKIEGNYLQNTFQKVKLTGITKDKEPEMTGTLISG